MMTLLRRGAPIVAAALVLIVGLLGASCALGNTGLPTVGSTPPGQPTPTFGITFNGKVFQCSQGACPPDVAWDGSRSFASTTGVAIVTYSPPTDAPTPTTTDSISLAAMERPFEQSPQGLGKVTIAKGSIFLVHTSGVPAATTPPALGTGYYSAVQVFSTGTDATGAPTLLLYFVTWNSKSMQKAAGSAAIKAPQKGAHVTVNMVSGGSLSVLDGSTSTGSGSPTATTTP